MNDYPQYSMTHLKGGAAQLPSPVPAPRSPALARRRLVTIIMITRCPDILAIIIVSAQSSLNFLHLCFPKITTTL